MSAIRSVRGVSDLLPVQCRQAEYIANTARDMAALYGYGEIAIPIFEFTHIFSRTLGGTTDVVSKEMYNFTDRGGNELSLRPEGTAGVARAFISNALVAPCKLFYRGPMFRYERPQKGRLRQFHQCGVECLGVAHPLSDVETILLARRILDALGLGEALTLRLNTLGDEESRSAYRRALVDYLQQHRTRLSPDSLRRLDVNPLRILDSKDAGDRDVVVGAPVFGDYLNAMSRDFFAAVQDGLKAHGIAYVHDPFLVRGLDYYVHTAFEFVSERLGAQNTVLAGGRYDGLIETLGGPSTPGIGWAAGLERLQALVDVGPGETPCVAVIAVGDHNRGEGLRIAESLRSQAIRAEMKFSGNVKKALAHANKSGAWLAVFVGDDEIERGAATVRDLESGKEAQVGFPDLPSRIALMVSERDSHPKDMP